MTDNQQPFHYPYHGKEPKGSLSECSVSSVIPVDNASMYSAVRDRGEITRQRQKWAAAEASFNSRNYETRRRNV